MGGVSRNPIVVIFAMAILASAPIAHASSSGLAISGFIETDELSGLTNVVSYSPNNEILAVGYTNGVTIYNSTTKEVLKTLNLNDAIESIEFSENGDLVAAGLKSLEAHQKSLLLLSGENGWNVIADTSGSKRVDALDFSIDSEKIAYSGSTTSLNEINTSDFSDIESYDGIHSEKVTCTSYGPDGNYILTGGEDGRIVKWNRSDKSGQTLYNFESFGISDCGYSKLGKIAFLSTGGSLHVLSENHEMEYSEDLTQVSKLRWSRDGLRLFVVQSFGGADVVSYTKTSDSWARGSVTSVGHELTDFDITADTNTMVVATKTKHIVEYSNSFLPLHYGESGLDSDGDGVPNDFDSDDDGDGIVDKWDAVCDGGISCSLSPDQDSIRNVKIVVSGSEISVFDIVLLTSYQSSAIRNLTASSIDNDGTLSDQEAYRVSNSICANLIEDDLIDAWKSKIQIEGATISGGSVDCSATTGLLGVPSSDYNTRIRMTTFTSFIISQAPVIPYNITLTGTAPMPSGSVAQIAPLNPILVTVDAEKSDEYDILWGNSADGITLSVSESSAKKTTFIEDVISLVIDNIIWSILIIAILVLSVLSYIRRKNAKSINFELEEDVDGYDEEENAGWRSDDGVSPPKPTSGPPNTRRSRVIIEEEVVKKRRVSTGKKPVDSKRTRLDEHKTKEEEPPEEWDYGWDATYDDASEAYDYKEEISEPKVRKVKVAKTTAEVPKRRKAKRRAKKGAKKKEENIDEEEVMSSALDKLISSNED